MKQKQNFKLNFILYINKNYNYLSDGHQCFVY